MRRMDQALKGLGPLDDDVEAVCRSLYSGTVPDLWMRSAYPGQTEVGHIE